MLNLDLTLEKLVEELKLRSPKDTEFADVPDSSITTKVKAYDLLLFTVVYKAILADKDIIFYHLDEEGNSRKMSSVSPTGVNGFLAGKDCSPIIEAAKYLFKGQGYKRFNLNEETGIYAQNMFQDSNLVFALYKAMHKEFTPKSTLYARAELSIFR